MEPIKHPLCNDILRRPAGMTEEQCRDLHIRREDNAVMSFWTPNPEELEAIKAGQPILLHFTGATHPPVMLAVLRPDGLDALKLPVVKLLGGPWDGCETISTHGTAFFEDEFYCHVPGDEADILRHAETYLSANTPGGHEQISIEREKVKIWMDETFASLGSGKGSIPASSLMPIPPDRVHVHFNMLRCGR